MAIFCARITFFAVIGKNAPAFTVASLAIIMNRRPQTRASPVTVPARGRAAPFLVHFERREGRPVQKIAIPGSISFGDSFAGREPALFVLRFDRFRATALANLLFLILDFGEQFDDASGILVKVGRIAIDG